MGIALSNSPKNCNKIGKLKIKHYLFEKGRVFNSEENKFNFHIFHSIIEGFFQIFNNNLLKIDEIFVKLIKTEYEYLMNNNLFENIYIKFHDDLIISQNKHEFDFHQFYLIKFEQFLNLLIDFKLSHKKIIKKIFNLLLAIIILQQIDIEIDIEGKAFISEENEIIQIVSKLLDCEHKLLRDKLISREIRSPRGSFYVVKFTPEEALRARNNFLKFLYENLFNFITRIINMTLNDLLSTNSTEDKHIIELIECFGFENSSIASDNTLENLFINYSNDKLNNLLFDMLIKGELELYKLEEIINESNFNFDFLKKGSNVNPNITRPRASSMIKMNINKSNGLFDVEIENTLQACDDTNKGIFKLLDVQSSLINTNHGLIKCLCDNIKLSWPQISTTNDSFFLVHFGSVVEYGASDFILKNVDSVSEELKEISTIFFKNFVKNFCY